MIGITIDADKLMYGYSILNIDIDNNTCVVSWTSIADGGFLCDEGEKEFININTKDLLSELKAIELPDCFDENVTYSWGFSIIDDENSDLSICLEQGEWNGSVLNSILHIINNYFMDKEILENIKSLIEF